MAHCHPSAAAPGKAYSAVLIVTGGADGGEGPAETVASCSFTIAFRTKARKKAAGDRTPPYIYMHETIE
jgi:hypothetical protein